MASFSATEAGGKITGDHHWLTDVLKGELDFDGFIVSDWQAVDQVDPDYATAVARSINAGIDMVMVPSDYAGFQQVLTDAVAGGTVPKTRIDDAVTRILRVKIEGPPERPMPSFRRRWSATPTTAPRREAVGRSLTLLKTSGDLLPLSADGNGPILLAGPGADDIGIQSGGWTITWQGADGATTEGTTIAAGLRERLGERLQLVTASQLADAGHAPLGILVVAERPYAEGVGDSATLRPYERGLASLPLIRSKVDRLIVVLVSGRPLVVPGHVRRGRRGRRSLAARNGGRRYRRRARWRSTIEGRLPYTWPVSPDDAREPEKPPATAPSPLSVRARRRMKRC